MRLDLGHAPILKIFISYAIPSILGMVFMMLAFIIDGIFIGHFVGSNGLAAVNMSYPIISLISGSATMITVGGVTLANINKGADDLNNANQIFTMTFALLAFITLFATVLLQLEPSFFIKLLGANDELSLHLAAYLLPLSVFFPAFAATIAGDYFIRADGNPKLPLIALFLASIVNIILDYIFIAIFELGLNGAAFATGLSQLMAALILFTYLIKKSAWQFVAIHFRLNIIWQIIFNGSSELIGKISNGIVIFIFNWFIITHISTKAIAAFSIAQYISMIAMAVFMGIAYAIQAGVSYNLGKAQYDRVYSLRNIALKTNIIIGIVIFVVMYFFSEHLIRMFANEDKELTQLSREIIFSYSFAYLLMGTNILFSTFYTAINQPKISMIIALTRSLIGLVLGLWGLTYLFGNEAIWLSPLFAETVCLIFIIISLFKHKKSPA